MHVFLALAEMRRSRGKFALLTSAVALLVYLILVQQAISGSLVRAFNGAIRHQSAPILVYSTDSLRSPQGSVIIPEWEQIIADDASVASSARVGILSATAEAGDDDAAIVTLWGAEDAGLGGAAEPVEGRVPETDDEAIGTAGDFEVGQMVTLGGEAGTSPEFEVVGLVEDAQLAVLPMLYTSYDAYESAATALNPQVSGVLPSLVAVEPAGSVEATITALTEASPNLDPLARDVAAEEFPGVAPVQMSFLIILGLFGFVVPLVTGLFFLILTFQKSRALTLLSAIGARPRVLVGSLLFQVLAVLIGGLALGAALYALTTLIEVGTLTLTFSWGSVAVWSAILLTLGVASALASVRRVLGIEPVEATRGGNA